MRRVDLDIGGAEANQLRDLITEDCDDVGEEVLKACIRGLGTFRATRNSRTGWGWAALPLRRGLCGRVDRRTPRRQDAVCARAC